MLPRHYAILLMIDYFAAFLLSFAAYMLFIILRFIYCFSPVAPLILLMPPAYAACRCHWYAAFAAIRLRYAIAADAAYCWY